MNYKEVNFYIQNNESREILLSMLAEDGYEGFVEEDDKLIASISENNFNENIVSALAEKFGIRYNVSTIKPVNWNAVWESNFNPVTVYYQDKDAPFVHIRAHFHEPWPQAENEIIITPKMSFGTGHHATTYLMAQAMAEINFTGKSVIDFGTGTGVLAILAEKLGAEKIIATDNDDWCIENALENLQANHCKRISVIKKDDLEGLPKADVILANINLNILLANMESIAKLCNKGAIILFSGILETDKQLFYNSLQKNGFSGFTDLSKNNWLLVKAKCA